MYDRRLIQKAKKRKNRYKRRRWLELLVAITVAVIGSVWGINNQSEKANTSPEQFDTEYPATVKRVVDGDTIIVSQDKKDYKVRLIGVNTPESVSSNKEENTPEGEDASAFTKAKLKKGTEVYLEFDKELTDQYGRMLAYVWLTDNCDYTNYQDFCEYNYGAILLQNTYCEAAYYAPNGKYKTWYEQLEENYQ